MKHRAGSHWSDHDPYLQQNPAVRQMLLDSERSVRASGAALGIAMGMLFLVLLAAGAIALIRIAGVT